MQPDEVLLEGARVCTPEDQTRVIVPWEEGLRYGTARNGYHGGATPQEMLPPLVILAGYFLSGRFFVKPSPSFEAWLIAWDRRLLGDPPTRFAHWPRALLAYLEVVYMGCAVLVPAGFASLAWTGRASLADSYWTLVIGAEFGSFASLGVVQARPPWMVERKAVTAACVTASSTLATSIKESFGSITRRQMTALIFTGTLSLVIVSCCSTAVVVVRTSTTLRHSRNGSMK